MNEEEIEYVHEFQLALFSLDVNKMEELSGRKRGYVSEPSARALGPWIRAVLTESPEEVRVAHAAMSEGLKGLGGYAQKAFWKGRSMDESRAAAHYLWARALLAELNLFYALLLFKLQKFVKGALVFRRSWKIYEDCQAVLRRIPADQLHAPAELKSAIYFGVGCFHYIVSIVPHAFKFVVETIGFKGDLRLAIEELDAAALAGGSRSLLAKIVLIALNSFFLNNEDRALAIYEHVVCLVPNSPVLQYFGGYLHRKKGDLAEAQQLFDAAAAGATQVPILETFALYERGYIRYLELDWPGAAELLEKFMTQSVARSYKAFGHYQIGLCYAMLFRNEEAKKHMLMVSKHVRGGYAFDEYAKRHAASFLSTGALSPFQRKFYAGSLHYEARRFEDCLDTAEQAESAAATPEERFAALHLRGDALKELSRPAEAEPLFEEVIRSGLPFKEHLYCYVGSMTSLAMIWITDRRRLDEADALLRRAKKYRNYDFENWTAMRIKRALEVLADIRAGSKTPMPTPAMAHTANAAAILAGPESADEDVQISLKDME